MGWNIQPPKRKKFYLLTATWINLEGIILSDLSQREKQILCNFTYMWNVKQQIS